MDKVCGTVGVDGDGREMAEVGVVLIGDRSTGGPLTGDCSAEGTDTTDTTVSGSVVDPDAPPPGSAQADNPAPVINSATVKGPKPTRRRI